MQHGPAALDVDMLQAIFAKMDAAQSKSRNDEEDDGNAYSRRTNLKLAFDSAALKVHFDGGRGPAGLSDRLAAHREYAGGLPALPSLVTNGRLLQLVGDKAFLSEDYALLEVYERQQRTEGTRGTGCTGSPRVSGPLFLKDRRNTTFIHSFTEPAGQEVPDHRCRFGAKCWCCTYRWLKAKQRPFDHGLN